MGQILVEKKDKILLHICCAGCGAYVSELLSHSFEIILFYYNPNINVESEYKKRLKEVDKIKSAYSLELIASDYKHEEWLKKIRGMETCPEKGKRCFVCYKDRLEATAIKAVQLGINNISSTLSLSPHKNFFYISKIANYLEKKYQLNFYNKDYKKKNGFQKSMCLSKKFNFYRQNYCGCEFSKHS